MHNTCWVVFHGFATHLLLHCVGHGVIKGARRTFLMKTFLKIDSFLFFWLVIMWIAGCGLPWPWHQISLSSSTYVKEAASMDFLFSLVYCVPGKAIMVTSNAFCCLQRTRIISSEIVNGTRAGCLHTWLALPQESNTFMTSFVRGRIQ